jgi:hypothetical protein
MSVLCIAVDFEEIEAAMNKENVKGPQEMSLEALETRDISGTSKKVATAAWGFQNGGAGLVKTLADKMNNSEAETEFTFRVSCRNLNPPPPPLAPLLCTSFGGSCDSCRRCSVGCREC